MSLPDSLLINDLFEINRRLSLDLWNICDVHSGLKGLSPRLICPEGSNHDIRISEQEAKILYCGLLNNLNYYYSVETPTQQTYMQKGSTPMAARTDLSHQPNLEKDCKERLPEWVRAELKEEIFRYENP